LAGLLLDTTVVIDLLRGRDEAVDRLRALRESGDQPHVCAINVEEIARGLRADERARAIELFAGLHLIPLGRAEGWQAGEWRRDYAERGRTLSQADCLVAAAALAVGGRLATGNPKRFPMAELTVEEWPPG
jgi:predicted nucleic acid-binding protein